MTAPKMRMPDGKSLAAVLSEWERKEEQLYGSAGGTGGHKQKRQRGRVGRRATSAAERAWDGDAVLPTARAAAVAFADDAERERHAVACLLSGRRRRRFLNDCLLHDLAGPLRASDIGELFAPVPFGRERKTLFSRLLEEETLAEKFMAGALPHMDAPPCPPTSALAAAWARVGRRGRIALRRGVSCSLPHVLEQEAVLRAFATASEAEGACCELHGDAFSRLLAHALCAWTGTLVSSSHTTLDGGRCTRVTRRHGAIRSDAFELPACSSFLLGLQ
jgi:hypothetical protein